MKTIDNNLLPTYGPYLINTLLGCFATIDKMVNPGENQITEEEAVTGFENAFSLEGKTDLNTIIASLISGSQFTSTQIASATYSQGTLEVTFTSGSTYSYADVPAHTWVKLLIAPSVGKAFNAEVKNKFTSTKL